MHVKITLKVILTFLFSLLFFSHHVFSEQLSTEDTRQQKQSEFQLAQVTIQFGVTEGDIVKRLEQAGYREIEVIRKGFVKLRVQACYEGSKYVVSVQRLTGKINRGTKIGECRLELGLKQIIAKLKNRGLSRIAVQENVDGDIRIVACERRRRLRIFINRYGDIVDQRQVGTCLNINADEIRQRLRDNGFNRIKQIDRTDRGGFIFEACFDDRRVRVRVNRRGRIRRQRRIGRCSLPINPNTIADVIASKGYDRISVLDRKLPVYQAEACNNLVRLQIRMNRFGDIVSEKQTGECDPPLTRKEVRKLLEAQGGRNIDIKPRGRGGNKGFLANTCLKYDRVEFAIDRYGSILKRAVVDECQAPRMNEVLDTFSKRNLKDMKMFIEACNRRNRLIRFEVDEFGSIVNRERIGRCKR